MKLILKALWAGISGVGCILWAAHGLAGSESSFVASQLPLVLALPAIDARSHGGTHAYAGIAANSAWQGGSVPTRRRVRATRSAIEIGTLYALAAAYGVGTGLWLSDELGVQDPGLFLVAPAVLGVAAPAAAFLLDEPWKEGMAASVSTGIALGAGLGTAGFTYQVVTSQQANVWGATGFLRATTLGATLGGVGGAVFGYYDEPPPESSAFVATGAFWGGAIGAMFGYGSSGARLEYSEANDSGSLGALIGFPIGAVGMGLLATQIEPSWDQISWMWLGAGLGAVASTPAYLLYLGEGGPPLKRGMIFSGTMTLLGMAAGGIFASGNTPLDTYARAIKRETSSAIEITYLGLGSDGDFGGLSLAGTWR